MLSRKTGASCWPSMGMPSPDAMTAFTRFGRSSVVIDHNCSIASVMMVVMTAGGFY
jgi:hypothetical protein